MLRKFIYIIPIALLAASCSKDFFDINKDPNNPTTIEVSKLLTTAERNLGDGLAFGGGNNGGLSQILAVYTHQISTREEPDQYGATGQEFFLGLAWSKLFAASQPSGSTQQSGVLQNLNEIIKLGTPSGNTRYTGIAKVLKAYTYSQLVDVFGDVPFSEANKLTEGILYPKFDKGADIYPQLLLMLDSAIADLTNTTAPNLVKPAGDDVIYGGNVSKWVRAANTIKLKLYTQMRLVKNVSAEVNALINGRNLISTTGESFLLPYGPLGSTDDRNPGFEDYYSTQRGNHVSPWFYEILKGYNPRINTGNPDPRVPYYIYNQLRPTQAPAEGNQTEYRDGSFVSIYFGSVGPDRDRSQQNTISLFGIYPIGGRYDQGDAMRANASIGTGAAPYRFITYADRLYLEAELMKVGLVSGDARARLRQAVEESFKQVDSVVTMVKAAQTIPALVGTPAVTAYVDKVLIEYDAKPNQQLEIIMTQKWISNCGNAVDQYTDYRRTGFPVLFDPKDPTVAPGGRVQPPINGDPVLPGAQKSVPVQLSRTFPFSLPWHQDELERNQNAPPQKNPQSFKVFWMP
ncbi:MAG: SusD/RagB family nutrient-binding outer membrane lipoprotein [Chitinophagaceae bacterium]